MGKKTTRRRWFMCFSDRIALCLPPPAICHLITHCLFDLPKTSFRAQVFNQFREVIFSCNIRRELERQRDAIWRRMASGSLRSTEQLKSIEFNANGKQIEKDMNHVKVSQLSYGRSHTGTELNNILRSGYADSKKYWSYYYYFLRPIN